MAKIKCVNTLNGGIDTDTTPESLDKSKLRDACNIDTLETGKYTKLTNMRGTTNVGQYLPTNTDLDTLNILGVFEVEILADYGGTGTYVTNKALIIFTYDLTGGSQIFVVDLITNTVTTFYPNILSTESLDFPPEGTVSASYTKDRGVAEIYWDDNRNELRKLILKYSTSPSFQMPTLQDINVRPRFGDIVPVFTGYGTDGYTISGTYQIASRFYSTTKGKASKWSLFTNPIPIANNEGCLFYVPLGDGAPIGQAVSKSIKLSIDFDGDYYTQFDSIQLAIVKNVDGLPIPSNTVYITTPRTDWYDNHLDIEYSDAASFLAPFPLEEVITEDAAVKCAKTQVIKDNVLVRGNITYKDFTNDRGTVDYDDAYNIKQAVCYNSTQPTDIKKGHFREEVYAFGVAWFDENFNFGLVQPLDFTKVYKLNPVRTIAVVAFGAPDSYDQLAATIADTTGLSCGDYFRYQNKAYQVCEVLSASSITAKYRPDLTTTSASADLEVLHGQLGNQAQGWAWKFPARCDNQFAILQDGLTQAVGLHIKGLKNHPSWAKGFVIVRQDRNKNIIFQSPHIPAIAAQGVPMQGKGALYYNDGDPLTRNKFDLSLADYRGSLDTVVPKIMGLGHAANICAASFCWAYTAGIGDTPHPYVAFYSAYSRHRKTYTNYSQDILPSANIFIGADANFIETFGAEAPRALFTVPPDYILNNGGQPTFNYPISGNEKIEIVDAVAMKRTLLTDDPSTISIANVYDAINGGYFYSKEGYVLRDADYKEFFLKLPTLDPDIAGLTVKKGYDIVLSESPLTLDAFIFDSPVYQKINIYGGTEQLSVQQGSSNAIPSGTNSFTNICSNQRGKLLVTNNALLDFTKVLADSVFGVGAAFANLFPSIDISDYSDKMYGVDHLEATVGGIGDSGNPGFNLLSVPVKTIFTDNEKIGSGAYILNITKGLPDNRYNLISTNWKFTGAVHYLTPDEVTNNTGIDIDVWGGDCFLSTYEVKVNNNTPRITDVFGSITDEAKDYVEFDDTADYFTFDYNRKTGSFENNVEIVRVIIESEVNTGYIKTEERVALDKPVIYFNKPFLYQYNGSYSVGNDLKTFVTELADISNNTVFEARYIWSKTRLYQARSSALIDVEGFDFFPVNNKRDLDEQYGGITALVDFGDYNLYLIQDDKIRVEPINRTVTNTADGRDVVMLSTNFVGSSGQYMRFGNGSQHIRSVKYFNGVCFFMDAERRTLVSFSPGQYDPLSGNDVNKYFLENYASPNLIKEKDLLGILNFTQEKQEYWLSKGVHGDVPASTMIYNYKTKTFKSRIDTSTDKILNGVSNGEFLFLLNEKELYTAYTNNKLGLFFKNYRPSTFRIVVNETEGYTKTFNVMNFEMKGGFEMNKDNIFATVPQNLPFTPEQNSADLLVWDSTTGQLAPFQSRNFQYWLNRIRQADTHYKMRGDYMIVDFIINNDEASNREVSIASIETDCTVNYPIR